MKNTLKYFLLLTLGFIALWSCQQDDFHNGSTANEISSKKTLKRLSLKDLQQDSKIYNAVKKFDKIKVTGSQYKTIVDTEYGFSIDTDDFVYIEENENHSYTFQIVRTDTLANLENLVLSYNIETQNYDTYLIEYLIDGTDQDKIENNEEISNFTSKTKISYLPEFNSEGLIQQKIMTISYIATCTYSVTMVPQLEGEVTGVHLPYVPVYTLISCTYNYTFIGGSGPPINQIADQDVGNPGGGGGGGGTPTNPNNPSTGNNNTGDMGSGNQPGLSDGNGGFFTTPIRNTQLLTPMQQLVSGFTYSQKSWWNNPNNFPASNFLTAYMNANTGNNNINNAISFVGNVIDNCNSLNFDSQEAINNYVVSQILQSEYMGLTQEQRNFLNNPDNQEAVTQILNYLFQNGLYTIYNNSTPRVFNPQSWEFAHWAVDFFTNNPNTTWVQFENWFKGTVDLDNNSIGGYDNTAYPMVNSNNLQQDWPTIESVIPVSDFVGFRDELTSDGTRYLSCMDFAKEQIAKKGYSISNYDAPGQTFQIYTESNGVDVNALWEGISYLKYALSNGIPVIVGIDNRIGSPNPHTDNTTDHFVVIVGTGVNFQGEIYFRFFDNATNYSSQGASPYNMLFLDNILNMLVGQTEVATYRNNFTEYNYIVTQIRKSK